MKHLTNTDSWREAVRKIITFRYFEDAELDRLLGVGKILEYGSEEPIIIEGDIDQHFYGIIKGTVSVTVHEKEGKDVFICALGAGEVFGEAGFFMNIRRTASITAKDTVTVFQLNRKEMTALIRDFPAAGNKILLITIYGLLHKLRQANQELAYERKGDMDQLDIDDLVNGLLTSADAKL